MAHFLYIYLSSLSAACYRHVYIAASSHYIIYAICASVPFLHISFYWMMVHSVANIGDSPELTPASPPHCWTAGRIVSEEISIRLVSPLVGSFIGAQALASSWTRISVSLGNGDGGLDKLQFWSLHTSLCTPLLASQSSACPSSISRRLSFLVTEAVLLHTLIGFKCQRRH